MITSSSKFHSLRL